MSASENRVSFQETSQFYSLSFHGVLTKSSFFHVHLSSAGASPGLWNTSHRRVQVCPEACGWVPCSTTSACAHSHRLCAQEPLRPGCLQVARGHPCIWWKTKLQNQYPRQKLFGLHEAIASCMDCPKDRSQSRGSDVGSPGCQHEDQATGWGCVCSGQEPLHVSTGMVLCEGQCTGCPPATNWGGTAKELTSLCFSWDWEENKVLERSHVCQRRAYPTILPVIAVFDITRKIDRLWGTKFSSHSETGRKCPGKFG